jgi:hypothetical protein
MFHAVCSNGVRTWCQRILNGSLLVSGADIILVATQILWSLGKGRSLFFFALLLDTSWHASFNRTWNWIVCSEWSQATHKMSREMTKFKLEIYCYDCLRWIQHLCIWFYIYCVTMTETPNFQTLCGTQSLVRFFLVAAAGSKVDHIFLILIIPLHIWGLVCYVRFVIE